MAFEMRRGFRASLVACAGLVLLSASRAHADDGVIVRVWGQPPGVGQLVFTRDSSDPKATLLRGLAGTLALELPRRIVLEAGGGALVSMVGGELLFRAGADGWVRAGWAPMIHSTRAGERGWDLQLVAMGGYRYLERSQIVYEDYVAADQSIHGVTFDGGVMVTHWAPSGAFAMRLMSGLLIPVAQSTTNDGKADKPVSQMRFAIPVGLEFGFALH